jgi:hypothetical protein
MPTDSHKNKKTKLVRTSTVLPSSWDFVRPSIQLVRQNIDTMLWLAIIPSGLSVLAGALFNRIVTKQTAGLGDSPTTAQTATAIQNIVHDIVTTQIGLLALGVIALAFLWTILAFPATIELMARAVQGKQTDVFSCLRAGFRKFWRIYAVSILATVIIAFGLLLFIVPGILLMRRYILAPYYLVDRNLPVFQALRTAAAESKPFGGYVLGTFGVFLFFNLLSSACNALPVIGLLLGPAVSFIYYFGFALRYKTITEAQKSLVVATEK